MKIVQGTYPSQETHSRGCRASAIDKAGKAVEVARKAVEVARKAVEVARKAVLVERRRKAECVGADPLHEVPHTAQGQDVEVLEQVEL